MRSPESRWETRDGEEGRRTRVDETTETSSLGRITVGPKVRDQ